MTPPSDRSGIPAFVREHPDAATAIIVMLALAFVAAAFLAIFLFEDGRAWKKLYELSEERRKRFRALAEDGFEAFSRAFGVKVTFDSAPETRRQRRARKLINLATATDNVHERRSAVRIAEELSARAPPVVK